MLGRPRTFYGTVKLPPSKSYLHRALFVSALATGESTLTNCGTEKNDDIGATIRALISLGARIRSIRSYGGNLKVSPGIAESKDISLDAGGSGTTARFLIPFSALSSKGTMVTVAGNVSLSKRPMQAIFEPLFQLGVKVKSLSEVGRLPIAIEGGGIPGGNCEVDGSISSQFVSSLLISCVKAERDSTVSIKNPEDQVSAPYIDATIRIMRQFGFKISVKRSGSGRYASFNIPGRQHSTGRKFAVPGDMSSGAALVGAALAARGELRLTNVGRKEFPQPDSAIVPIARRFGAEVAAENGSLSVRFRNRKTKKELFLDLRNSPDLVPTVAGLAAATGTQASISNIGHLRFKESDRISVLSRELSKIGVRMQETKSDLRILGVESRPREGDTLICPEGDHRMVMALTIAGLSGRFGSISIEDPDCVGKSYPSFVADLQKLCHEKSTLKIIAPRNARRAIV